MTEQAPRVPAAADTVTEPDAAKPQVSVILLAGFMALGPLTLTSFGPIMPVIADALGVDTVAVQPAFSAFLIGFGFGQLIYGPLSDRFGRRPLLLLGLAVYLVATLGCLLADSAGILLIGRLLQGAGAAAGAVVTRAMVRDLWSGREAAAALSGVMMALGAAPAVGPLLGSYTELWFGWRALFLGLGIAALAIVALAVLALPETNRSRNPQAASPAYMLGTYAKLLRHPVFLGYLAVGACSLGGSFTFHTVTPHLMIDLAGLSVQQFSWLVVATVAAFLLGSTTANRLSVRLGIEKLTLLAALPMAAGALGLLAAAVFHIVTVWSIFIPGALWVISVGIMLPISQAGAINPFPEAAGLASALFGFLQMGTGAVGGLVASGLQNDTVWPLALVLCALLCLAVIPFLLLIRPFAAMRDTDDAQP